MYTTIKTLALGALAVGLLPGAAAAGSNCTAIRPGTNDFDQVRETGSGTPGLPNDGRAYCYPASWTSWMAYLNQQGFPEAMHIPIPIVDWSGQAAYDLVTSRIELMGTYCSTSATGGTTGPRGVLDYLEAAGLGDQFFFTETEVNWSDPFEFITPHLTTWDIHANMFNSGLVAITIGWSDYVDGVNVGTGAHVVGVGAIIGPTCTDANLLLRDPGMGGNGLTQSPYSFTETTMSNVFGDFQRGSFPPQSKMLPQLDVYGDREAFLVAIFTLYPTNAASIPAAQTSIVLHRPWQFIDVGFPEVQTLPLPAGLIARDMALHPSGQGVVVMAEDDGQGRLMWLGYLDEEYQPVPDFIPDPGPLAVNRFGEIYTTTGNDIHRMGLGLDEGMIVPTMLSEGNLELPLAAVAAHDANDLVYGLMIGSTDALVFYDRMLDYVGWYNLPAGVDLAGKPVMVPAAGAPELWLASSAGPDLYRFIFGPDGAPALAETVQLPGIVDGIEGLHVFHSGRVLVVLNDSTREFTRSDFGGWSESDATGFNGLSDVMTFHAAMSRSTAPTYMSAEDRPDWPAVLPEDDQTPCPGDLDHDGSVGFADILIVLASWGPCDLLCPGDVNEDHAVTFEDLLAVLAHWGDCPE